MKSSSNNLSDIQDLISVIIPCYNGENFLKKAIDSVLGQTYRQVQIIVIDDGSSDGSNAIASSYGDRLRLVTQKNQGLARARNNGILESKGEYIAFLDADDYWRSDCLELLHKALKHSNAVLAYCGWQNLWLSGKTGEPYTPPDYESGNKLEYFLKSAAPWPVHAALVRRNVLIEAGGFDVQLPSCEDYDLWLRIAVSRPIVRVPEVLAFYVHHNSGQMTSKQWVQAAYIRLVKKNFVSKQPELCKSFSRSQLREFIDGAFLQRGYQAYWRRDLVSAQKIFRKALLTGYWSAMDLKYLLPAFLPGTVYTALINKNDRRNNKSGENDAL